MVKSLFDRARRVVTRESDLRDEEKHLRQVLLNNGYPQPFIDENSRVRSVRPRDEETSTPLVVIPYVSGLSEDIRGICRRFGVRVVFKSGMSLRSQLSRLKDVLPLELHSGIVYKIPCSICEKVKPSAGLVQG